MNPLNLLNHFRQWLGESRRNQLLAASAALVAGGAVAALGIVLAFSGGGDGGAPAAEVVRESPTAPATTGKRSPTTRATPGPTASPVAKPDPQTLLPPGYVLDQSLDVNLDGSKTGQRVLISHTSHQMALCSGQALDPKTGQPPPTPKSGCEDLPATVPAKEDCSQNPNLDPASCWFRAEVFAFDISDGWTGRYVSKNHRAGVQEFGDAKTFRLDANREALVLAFHYCTGTGSGCGGYHEVVAMQNGEIKSVYNAWQASVTLGDTSATFDNPALFRADAFCCPSGRSIETLALDPSTNDIGVVESRLLLCSEGTLANDPGQAYPLGQVELRCESGYPVSLYDTTDQIIVEPATIGGLQGLSEGDRVRIESTILEGCPDPQSPDCRSDTLIATKITALNP